MTANRTYLTWPATYLIRVISSGFLIAGLALGWLWMNQTSVESETESDSHSEMIKCPRCHLDLETSSEDDNEAVQEPEVRMPPGFTVSWANGGFRYCMRSGIAHYSLPPE